MQAKKSLGQHWLNDPASLRQIVGQAQLTSDDVVLEIGPGKGALTRYLLASGARVIAVEYDKALATFLANDFANSRANREIPSALSTESANFQLISADFLDFDLESLPAGYKIIGNIPYYITGKIVRKCLSARNKPSLVVLLVQKEVAQRIAASAGELSIIGVLSQFYAEVSLGAVVSADRFSPPPKVDSQVVVLRPRPEVKRDKIFESVVRAGFSAKRKKLKTALAGGLGITKTASENLLKSAAIDPDRRAQDLSLSDWRKLRQVYH
jgi:16S rRNA (adenine1518-N6/adenine1519-N6)-dimethyltransferase